MESKPKQEVYIGSVLDVQKRRCHLLGSEDNSARSRTCEQLGRRQGEELASPRATDSCGAF